MKAADDGPIPDGYVLVIQALLWAPEVLAALLVRPETLRRVPRPVRVRVLPAGKQVRMVPLTVATLCRELRFWRNWQVALRRRMKRHPEDTGLKAWYTHIEKRLRWLEDAIWAQWQEAEKPRWKRAS